MKKCWLKTAALAAGCLAFLLGGFSGCKGEIEDFDDDGDVSTRIAIDISTNADTKDWTEVAAYVYGGSIGDDGFGAWPGLVLKQSESNPAVFYSDDLSGKKLGNGTIIFNNNNHESQIDGIEFSISKGQKLLFKARKFVKASSADLGISSAGNDSKDGETDSQSDSANSGNNAANADGTSPASGKSDSASGGNNDATDTESTNPASGNANDGDVSTRIAIDISTNDDTKGWTEVAAYVYGGSIGDNGWGNWPGIVLKKSESNPTVFYSDDLSGKKLGNGTIIFNNNNNGSQTKDIEFTIEEKQKLIYRAGKFDRTSAADLGISSAGNDSKDGETDSQSDSANSGNNAANADGTSPAAGKSDSASGGNNDATDTGSTNPASGNANDGDESTSPASGNAGGNASGNGANESGSTAGEATTQEPASETNDGNGEAETKEKGKFTVAITADYWKLGEATPQVNYWSQPEGLENAPAWNDAASNMTKNDSLGMWVWESKEIEAVENATMYVQIHVGDTKFVDGEVITINKPKLYTHAETWIDWDGTSLDSTTAVAAPDVTIPAIPDFDTNVTVIAIDTAQQPKLNADIQWNKSAMRIWGWGGNWEDNSPFTGDDGWGSSDAYKMLSASTSDTNTVFYWIIPSGKEPQNATVCFHDDHEGNDNDNRFTIEVTLAAGEKKIVIGGQVKDWTSQ